MHCKWFYKQIQLPRLQCHNVRCKLIYNIASLHQHCVVTRSSLN